VVAPIVVLEKKILTPINGSLVLESIMRPSIRGCANNTDKDRRKIVFKKILIPF